MVLVAFLAASAVGAFSTVLVAFSTVLAAFSTVLTAFFTVLAAFFTLVFLAGFLAAVAFLAGFLAEVAFWSGFLAVLLRAALPTLAALGLATFVTAFGLATLGLVGFEKPSPTFVTALSTLASLKLWAPFLPAGAADTSAPAAFSALTALRILAGALAASTGKFPITNFLTVTSEEPVLDLVSATACLTISW